MSNFNFTIATYDTSTETVTVNGETFEFGKYWKSQEGVSDVEGFWDNDNKNFIPNGLFDETTGYIKVN
tara:strand:- start:43 stop:246 length:204 start_codon:yes stop_codon:yes gene_type:complete